LPLIAPFFGGTIIEPTALGNPSLDLAIPSPALQEQIWASVKAAARPWLYINRMLSLLIPLSPLTEQHRILAKVDELIAHCVRLEAGWAEHKALRDRLTTASLARLSAPDTDAETFKTHARCAIEILLHEALEPAAQALETAE